MTSPAPERRAAPQGLRAPGPPRALVVCVAALLVALIAAGLPYYVLDLGPRLRSPLHPWFKPTGYVGQTAGILTFALFLFLWLYPLRKRVRALAFTGAIGRWLDVHIAVGMLVPVLGAIHASWRFDGLIGLGYFSMLTVSLSGFVGKYLYARIPRGRMGLELSRREVAELRTDLVTRIARSTGLEERRVAFDLEQILDRARSGADWILPHLLFDDLARWRAGRALRRRWAAETPGGAATASRADLASAVRLARRELALAQQSRMLEATQRVFRYWHVAHLPVAITALVAVLLHVVIAVALGVTWFW